MGIQINGQTDTISSTDGSLNIGGTVTVQVTGDATGLTGTPNITVGVVTASSATISGDLTVNGTTTTLDTTLTEVDKLEVGANNTTVGVAITQSGTGDILRLYDGASQVVTVDDEGNFGVGTNTPNNIFNIQYNNSTSYSTTTTSGSGYLPSSIDALSLVNSVSTISNGFSSLHFRVNGSSGNAAGKIVLGNTIAGNGFFAFQMRDGSHTSEIREKLRINSSGNIGINTTTPSAKLDVMSTGNFTVDGDTFDGVSLMIRNDGGTQGDGNYGSAIAFTQIGNPGVAGYRAAITSVQTGADSDQLGLAFLTHPSVTGGDDLSEALRITSGGNVGIGTDIIDARLHIGLDGVVANTTAQVDVSDWGSTGYINLKNMNGTVTGSEALLLSACASNGGVASGIGFGRENSSNWGTYISFKTHSTSTSNIDELYERLRITSSGNIGIGTDNPATNFKLDVNGDLSLGEFGGTDNSFIDQKQNGSLEIINSGRDSNDGKIRINRFNNISGDTTYYRDFELYDGKSNKIIEVDGSAAMTRIHMGTDKVVQFQGNIGEIGSVAGFQATNTSGSANTDFGIRATTIRFATGSFERLRIDSSGNFTLGGSATRSVDIGTQSRALRRVYSDIFVHREGTGGAVTGNNAEVISYGGEITVLHDNVTLSTNSAFHRFAGSRSGDLLRMRNNGGGAAITSESGGITATSDYRIKENVTPIIEAISAVKSLNPVKYTIKKSWNSDATEIPEHGFIAHEVAESIPNIRGIVYGEKDAVNEDDGGINAQSVDYARLTPILCAALKECIEKIETLEAEVAALKAQ